FLASVSPATPLFVLVWCDADRLDLPSFPTRRSSDLLDAVLAGGHEVPPDMAWSQRLAAQQHQVAALLSKDTGAVAFGKDQHLAGWIALPTYFQPARTDINGALFVAGWQRDRLAGLHAQLHIEQRRGHTGGTAQTQRRAGNQTTFQARILNQR